MLASETMAVFRRMSHGEQLARRASKAPERPALTFEGVHFTYGERDPRVSRRAGGLESLGVMPGTRVAIFMQNRLEVVEAYSAILR